jgi:hypothetical protein
MAPLNPRRKGENLDRPQQRRSADRIGFTTARVPTMCADIFARCDGPLDAVGRADRQAPAA